MHINGHQVDTSLVNELASFPTVLPTNFQISELMEATNNLTTCIGNLDPKFVAIGRKKRNRQFLSNSKKVVAYIDSSACVTVDEVTHASTIRSLTCQLLTTTF